jgi:RNA polymerase sigma-54 factor
MYDLGLDLDTSNEQQLRVSPTLVMLNEILVMSSAELQEEINKELASNPALEMDEGRRCPLCGSMYKGKICQQCQGQNLAAVKTEQISQNTYDYSPDDMAGNYSYGNASGSDDDFDIFTVVAAEMSLSERIITDLSAVVEEDDYRIAEFLVGSLDERGFLTSDVASVAQVFNTDEERVERVLKQLQQVAPPGVGARNIKECLLLQVVNLREDGIENPHVETVINKYFDELGAHKYSHIAHKMGVSVEEIEEVRDFIKNNLNPFPAEGQVGELNGTNYQRGRAGSVVPDVIITEDENGRFQVEVVESNRFYLKINPLYAQLAGITKAPVEPTPMNTSDQEHIRQYYNRARLFLSNIQQRRETMRRIANALVEIQEDFLRNGVRSLKPLTRSTLASYLGYHESTVSRATAGKYIQLPNRKVIPFSDFFAGSLSVKDVIKEIIEVGQKDGTRLTDQAIVDKLAEQNIYIARRTVAKYRNSLKILPSTLR